MKSKGTVTLQQLVPQHDCLKLLILHTPYSLNIDSLPRCINLVKLDLSRNNLRSFPCISHFKSLRFMFLHDNLLSGQMLAQIFAGPIHLRQNIVWVTFYGNRQGFIARHYLVNNTNVLAVDRHLVMPCERAHNSILHQNTNNQEQNAVYLSQRSEYYYYRYEAFSSLSDVSALLETKVVASATEEEYMAQLWDDMRYLRRKYQHIFSVVKIQKYVRGWIQRRKNKKKHQIRLGENCNSVSKQYFGAWKKYTVRRRNLKMILKNKNKEYLLFEKKQVFWNNVEIKMRQWLKRVRENIKRKNNGLTKQLTVLRVLKGHYQRMKLIYTELGFTKQIKNISLYCLSEQIPLLRTIFNKISPIKKYPMMTLRLLHDDPNKSETIRQIQTSKKSITYLPSSCSPCLSLIKNLKPPYRSFFTIIQQQKMKGINEALTWKAKMEQQQLVLVEASKDLIRAIHAHNVMNSTDRIIFIAGKHAQKSSAAIHIQKNWKGYITRKNVFKYLRKITKYFENTNKFIQFQKTYISLCHNILEKYRIKSLFKSILLLQRATIRIQRWFRKRPYFLRQKFISQVLRQVAKIQDTFYITFTDYKKILAKKDQNKFGFLQQHLQIKVCNQKLVLFWDPQIQNIFCCIEQLIAKKRTCSEILLKKALQSNEISEYILYKNEFFDQYNKNQQSLQTVSKDNYTQSLLLHYATKIQYGNKFIGIQCKNKTNARFRAFVLLLKNQIKIYTPKEVHFKQKSKTINIQQCLFISSKKINCPHAYKQYLFNAKMYFPMQEDRPLKLTAIIYAYWPHYIELKFEVKSQTQLQNKIQYKTQINVQNKTQINIRKKPQRRYIKKKKVFKPSFLIESISQPTEEINQKMNIRELFLQKQTKRKVSQVGITQQKRYGENNPRSEIRLDLKCNSMSDLNDNKLTPSVAKLQSQQINNEISKKTVSMNKNSQRRETTKSIIQKKSNREHNQFVSRFVNLSNFVAHQCLNQRKRRIQTQYIESNKVNVEKIKIAHINRLEQVYKTKKQKKIKTEVDEMQQIQKPLKIQKRYKPIRPSQERNIMRKLKVSFAEQCFPILRKS